jgi:hypothetical protein
MKVTELEKENFSLKKQIRILNSQLESDKPQGLSEDGSP